MFEFVGELELAVELVGVIEAEDVFGLVERKDLVWNLKDEIGCF